MFVQDHRVQWQVQSFFLSSLALILSTVSAQGASFTYTPLNLTSTDFANITGPPLYGGINDSGQLVIGGPAGSLLRQSDGTISTISPPSPGFWIGIKSLNNAGQMIGIVGGYVQGFAFRDSNGTYTNNPTIGCGVPYLAGLNNVGQIVADACGGGVIMQGLSGSYQLFNCPNPFTRTTTAGINDRGQVVGSCQYGNSVDNTSVMTAFIRDTNGSFTLIRSTGWTWSQAVGINSAGQVVGTFGDSTGTHSFFRDTDGTISFLAGTVFGINNRSQLVGYGIGPSTPFQQVYIATISNRQGVLSHIAAGGGWSTVITLINTSSAAVPVTVALHNDDGSALTLPVTTTQQSASQTTTTSSVNATINPNATLLISMGNQVASTIVGWADVTSTGPVGGYAIFRWTPQTGSPSEGTVPLLSQFPSTITLPYDNTAGFVMGVALANLSTASANITATIWDDSGNQLGTQNLTIAGSGHTSFVLPNQIALTAGKRGIVQFQSAASGGLAGLGLRFSPFATLTSVPTM